MGRPRGCGAGEAAHARTRKCAAPAATPDRAMNRRHWIDQRRDAAIDAVLGHLAPPAAGLTLGCVATAISEPATWLPGFALVALGVAQCIVRMRARTVLLSRDCESGDRERQRSEAGSERPPVPMQDAGTGPAGGAAAPRPRRASGRRCPGGRSSCIPSIWRARPTPARRGTARGARAPLRLRKRRECGRELRDDARLLYGRGLRAPPRGHDPRGCEGATPRCGGAAYSGWRGVREAGVSRSSRSGGGWCWHACDARQRWSHRPPARSGRGAPRLRCRRRPSPFRRPRAWTAGP